MTHTPRARRCLTLASCACLAIFFLASFSTHAVDTAAAKEISAQRLTYVVRAVRAARPAVVNIQGQKVVASTVQTAAGTEAPRQVNGMGTGVVIDERGYILTNYHVVADVRRIQVALYDHREFTAEMVARDPVSDLAVIKISPPEPLPLIKIGTSSDLMEGEPVIALGQCVWVRAYGDARHHQRARPRRASQRHADLRRLDPDRRQHQPRQLGRPADERRRRNDRAERRRAGRRPGHWLRHSGRSSDARRRPTDQRRTTRTQATRLGDPCFQRARGSADRRRSPTRQPCRGGWLASGR